MSKADTPKLKKEALLAKMAADRASLTMQIKRVTAVAPRPSSPGSTNTLSVLSRYGYLASAALAGVGLLGPKLLKGALGFGVRRLVQMLTGLVVRKVAPSAVAKAAPAKAPWVTPTAVADALKRLAARPSNHRRRGH